MSFTLVAPEALVAAASDVAGIGSTIKAAHAAAAVPTTGVLAAASDEVSAQVAAVFSTHAQNYQQLSALGSAFHDQFVQALNAGAHSYAAAEANAVQNLVNAVNAPAEKLLGQPLIGSGSNAGSGMVSNALGRVQSIVGGTVGSCAVGAGAASANTAGTGGVTLANSLQQPAAIVSGSPVGQWLADTIEYFYNATAPWANYAYNLAEYYLGWVPILGTQINFFHSLVAPIVNSAVFNTVDWLNGTIAFSQGLNNFWVTTTSSINQFINSEINWVLGFLPPLPPLP